MSTNQQQPAKCKDTTEDYSNCDESREEEEEELVRRECFKCNKIYYDVEYSCCCGKCCSYCRESDTITEQD